MTTSQQRTETAPADSETRLTAAIIGTGMIGTVHRNALRAIGVEVRGVVGSRPQKSVAAAAGWRVPAALVDFEQILESGIGVVHVCTPNATHLDYAMRAVEAGKHVVVEKPVGMSAGEALALADAARAAGVIVTVPFVYRFHPVVREIRARRLSGELGDIHTIHGSYLQDWLLSPHANNWRVDPRRGGASRAFADIGSHWCDLVEWVAGTRFTEVSAATEIGVRQRPATAVGIGHRPEPGAAAVPADGHVLRPVATEDIATAMFRAPETLAAVTVSQLAAGRKNRLWFEIDGATGSAAFDQENPEHAWFGEATGHRVFARDPGTGSSEQRRLSALPAGHPQGYAHCFQSFLGDSYAAMDGAAVPGLPTVSDGVRAAHIVEAVLASAGSGTWVPISQASRAHQDPPPNRQGTHAP